MITAYYRPKTIEEALHLLSKPDTIPMGGGILINRPTTEKYAVVDLQGLQLNYIRQTNNRMEIGATVTLQQLMEEKTLYEAVKSAIKLEIPLNLRNMASVAGTLVAANGRSTFSTVMLALDAKISFLSIPKSKDDLPEFSPVEVDINIGDFLPTRKSMSGKYLITKISISQEVNIQFESVARTPADIPIVSVALAQWSSKRTRLAIGGTGEQPILAMDGNEPGGIEYAIRNALSDSEDEWASSEYRMSIGTILAKRCLEGLPG